jgi:hypothetical protein
MIVQKGQQNYSQQETDQDDTPKFLNKPRLTDQQVAYTQLQLNISNKMTDVLWVFSTWFVVILNFITFSLSIRDMWNNGYSPSVHWASSAVLVATIGGIITIHNYLKKQ